jgi:L-threonylcarbamoyladenylate synthase
MTPATRLVDVRAFDPADPVALEPALERLRTGGLIGYPTETVYGFGGAVSHGAVGRLLALKARGSDRPVLVLVDGPDAVADLAWTDDARELARVFWPGGLTLVLADPAGRFPPGVRSGAGAVAVRYSAHPVATALVRGLGGPITSTSANAPGRPPARSGAEAAEAAAGLPGGGDLLVLDAGMLPPSEASTVIDCTRRVPAVLRPGSVPPARVRCVVPGLR